MVSVFPALMPLLLASSAAVVVVFVSVVVSVLVVVVVVVTAGAVSAGCEAAPSGRLPPCGGVCLSNGDCPLSNPPPNPPPPNGWSSEVLTAISPVVVTFSVPPSM